MCGGKGCPGLFKRPREGEREDMNKHELSAMKVL
jgi:hypothetical protein